MNSHADTIRRLLNDLSHGYNESDIPDRAEEADGCLDALLAENEQLRAALEKIEGLAMKAPLVDDPAVLNAFVEILQVIEAVRG